MKKIFTTAMTFVMAVSFGTASAFAAPASAAAGPEKGMFGFSVGMGDSVFGQKTIPQTNGWVNDVVNISGRYFIMNDLAIIGGFGLQIDGGDADSTYFSFSGGVRKYFSKSGDLAPFAGGKLTYASVKDTVTDPITNVSRDVADTTVIDLEGSFGAEYYFSKQFSMDGAVGVGFGQAKVKDIASNRKNSDTYFGTRTLGVRANFYF